MNIKENIGAISSGMGILATIVAGTIYINTNFAQAADVEKILDNQQKQIELYSETLRSNRIFQLEYYDDRIRKLSDEKEKAIAAKNMTGAKKPITRSVEDIQADIDDTKKRRELIRNSIIKER